MNKDNFAQINPIPVRKRRRIFPTKYTSYSAHNHSWLPGQIPGGVFYL